MVRKILRSLSEIFKAKVIDIEKSKDVDSLKVDELVGLLQTFEITLRSPKKSKDICGPTYFTMRSHSIGETRF